MEIKKFIFVLFSLFVFLLPICAKPRNTLGFKSERQVKETHTESDANNSSGDSADDAESGNSEDAVEDSWQYLEWDEAYPEYVSRYEAVIEAYSGKTKSYSRISRLFTEGNEPHVQVQPLLPPGNYRYKVITYNLIDVPEIESDWFEFKIYKAFQPEITDIHAAVNLTSNIFLEENNDGIFIVTGRNLFDLSESETDVSFTDYMLVSERRTAKISLRPTILEHDDKNRRLKVQFDMKSLDTGTYYFVATDASGLKNENSRRNEITVKFKKRFDFNLSAGYSLPVILYDDTFYNYMGSNVWPLSASVKFSALSFKHRYGYFGAGLSGTYARMDKKFDGYKLGGNMILTHGLFVYQLPIRMMSKTTGMQRHILTIETHVGPGLTMFTDYKFDFGNEAYSSALNSGNFSILAGGAVQYYITNRLYAEADIDYVNAFTKGMQFGALIPSLSVGWQF